MSAQAAGTFDDALEGDDPPERESPKDEASASEVEREAPTQEREEGEEGADNIRVVEDTSAPADAPLGREADEEAEGESGEPREEGGQRHRRTSKERRENRKRYQNGLRAENQFLANQVQALMQRLSHIETGQGDSRLAILDSDLKRCSDEVATADRVYVNALKAAAAGTEGASEDVLQATRFREQTQARLDTLQQDRERLTQALAQARNQPPPTLPVPGSAQADQHEARFRAERPWLQFDAQSRPLNVESAVAKTIGVAMRAEGRDPTQANYWIEMDRRLRGAVPQMFEEGGRDEADEDSDEEEERGEPRRSERPLAAATPQSRRDRGPPVGRSGRNGGANRETVVPRQVVEALKEAGMWDDPKERKEALKYFREAGTVK